MDTAAKKTQNETVNQITTASIRPSSPTPVKADASLDTDTGKDTANKTVSLPKADLTAPEAQPTPLAPGVGPTPTPKAAAPTIKIPVPAGDTNKEITAIKEQTAARQGQTATALPVAPKIPPPTLPTPVNTMPSPNPTDRAVAGDPGPVPPLDPGLTREQKITELLKHQYLRVAELEPGANFSHRGFCAKCGWQTYQHSAEAAASLVTTHIMSHWKDVVRFL